MLRPAVLLTIIFFAIAVQPANGEIIGFGDGSGYTLNSNVTSGPSIDNGTLTLTDGGSLEAMSAFYNTPQSTGSFTASFTYQAFGVADGVSFVVQNDPAGPSALGGAGSGLGYAAAPGYPSQINNSVGLEINLYYFTLQGTLLETQGATGIFSYLPVTPVSFYTSDPIAFTLTYNANAQTLSETLVDTVLPTDTYSHTFSGINIASEVGGSSAYFGFTGGSGGLSSTQTISDFQFNAAPVPEPGSLSLALVGIAATFGVWLVRRAKIASAPTACLPALS